MFFDRAYSERATLRDGRTVIVRLVSASDKPLLRAGFGSLSTESRYRRFFSVKADLSDDELRYLTEVDGYRHFALGAVTEDGGQGLGVARFIQIDGEPGVAEAAIAVVDALHGQGLGSLLFQRLVAAASERGVSRFRCEMLGTNASMGELVRSLAPAASVEVASGVVRMEFMLPALEPDHPADLPPRDTGLYRLMALVAKGVFEWRARWQRLGERLMWGDPTPEITAVIGETAAGEADLDDGLD